MSTTLVIVESPSKAKTIAKYLGAGYTLKASMGHVGDLPEKGLGVDIEGGFTPEYRVSPEKGKTVAQLRKAVREADHVLLATDPDREGEDQVSVPVSSTAVRTVRALSRSPEASPSRYSCASRMAPASAPVEPMPGKV